MPEIRFPTSNNARMKFLSISFMVPFEKSIDFKLINWLELELVSDLLHKIKRLSNIIIIIFRSLDAYFLNSANILIRSRFWTSVLVHIDIGPLNTCQHFAADDLENSSLRFGSSEEVGKESNPMSEIIH